MNKATGYTVYSEQAKTKTKINRMPDLYPDFPEKQFDIIYADPPWDYGGKLQFDKSRRAQRKLTSRKISLSVRLHSNIPR